MPCLTADECLLVFWINERENIRLRREEGADKPWTDNWVLQQYRFCNVRREDDRVTKWVAANWRNGYPDHPLLTPAMVLARMFNLPDHLAEFPDFTMYTDSDHWLRDCKVATIRRRAKDLKLFNGAYLITTCGVKMDKVDYVYEVVRQVASYDYCYDSLESIAKQLMNINGIGSFLSAQVVADLKNTPGHPFQGAPDWWSWAAPGPGSRRGLQRALGGLKVPERQFLAHATPLYERIAPHLGEHVGPLHMQDFQNCLCEYDKYRRALGGGRPKQRYPGAG